MGLERSGETVSLTTGWDGREYAAVADSEGRWEMKVRTAAAGGPYSLTIATAGEARDTVKIEDVMLGEVWICAGQSNMAMPVRGYTGQPVENSLEITLEAGKYQDRIRVFSVERDSSSVALDDCRGKWSRTGSKTVARTSAIAYLFARRLADALDVPVGIVVSAYGGTKIEAWTPAAELHDALDGKIPSKDLKAKFAVRNSSVKDGKTINTKKPGQVGTICNAMIHPLAPYTARGLVWYQGCSNVRDFSHYDLMQEAMVRGWRALWQQELPFYFISIAPHDYKDASGDNRPQLVESQIRTLKTIPESHIVVTEGFGEEACIHPPKKQPVADRLAWSVLCGEYRFDGFPADSPMYLRHEVEDGAVIVYFSDSELGLFPTYGETVKGFEIAGKDGKWVAADAEILRNPFRVAVRSGEVPKPVKVRYSYHNYAESNLRSVTGLTVPPFCTR